MSAVGEPDDDIAEVDVGVETSDQRGEQKHRCENQQSFAPAFFFHPVMRSRRMAAHDAIFHPSNISRQPQYNPRHPRNLSRRSLGEGGSAVLQGFCSPTCSPQDSSITSRPYG